MHGSWPNVEGAQPPERRAGASKTLQISRACTECFTHNVIVSSESARTSRTLRCPHTKRNKTPLPPPPLGLRTRGSLNYQLTGFNYGNQAACARPATREGAVQFQKFRAEPVSKRDSDEGNCIHARLQTEAIYFKDPVLFINLGRRKLILKVNATFCRIDEQFVGD